MRYRFIALALVCAAASAADSANLEVADCSPMPRLVHWAAPQYPAEIHHFRGGKVVVEFVIEETGLIRDPIIVESSIEHRQAGLIYEATRAAAGSWRFERPRAVCRGRCRSLSSSQKTQPMNLAETHTTRSRGDARDARALNADVMPHEHGCLF
jgi:hypothetical protein